MRTIARYFSMIFIVGMLLGSTGCYLERYHDHYGHHDDRDHHGAHDDHKDHKDHDDHGNHDDHH